MKNYLIFFLFAFITIIHSAELKAQETNPYVKQGGYIYAELGGVGLRPIATVNYDYIKPLNSYSFLSARIGFNGMDWAESYNYGVPHSLSINLGKENVFFEAGLNGWFGNYTYTDYNPDKSTHTSYLAYSVGTNLGVNILFDIDIADFMFRIYGTYNYDVLVNNPIEDFFGLGIGFAVRIHR
jgi:hypothetical protein